MQSFYQYDFLVHRYAFIVQKTAKEAKRNFLKPIDHNLLGPDCRVKYGRNSGSLLPIGYRPCDDRTVVVKNIPDNVSENDIRRVFPDCHVSKYCPARTVYRTATSTAVANRAKALWG